MIGVNFWERLQRLDRRVIFILIAAVVAIPLIWPPRPKLQISPPTQKVFDYIEKLPPGSVVALCFDYGPSSAPELDPMAYAILRQCLTKGVKVIVMTLDITGKQMKSHALNRVVAQLEQEGVKPVAGDDYLDLPYQPGYTAVVLGMGEDVHKVFPIGTAGGKTQPIGTWPLMDRVHTMRDLSLVVDLASSNTPTMWVLYGASRFGVKVAAGVTAVMVMDYYPFLQSKQLVGLLGGMKGAAEYEQLLKKPGLGMSGMGGQKWGHLVIIAFVVVGNIGYFASRRAARRAAGAAEVG